MYFSVKAVGKLSQIMELFSKYLVVVGVEAEEINEFLVFNLISITIWAKHLM